MRFMLILGLLLGAACVGCENTAFYKADTRTWFDPKKAEPVPGENDDKPTGTDGQH
jgi:hypothetical protein